MSSDEARFLLSGKWEALRSMQQEAGTDARGPARDRPAPSMFDVRASAETRREMPSQVSDWRCGHQTPDVTARCTEQHDRNGNATAPHSIANSECVSIGYLQRCIEAVEQSRTRDSCGTRAVVLWDDVTRLVWMMPRVCYCDASAHARIPPQRIPGSCWSTYSSVSRQRPGATSAPSAQALNVNADVPGMQ
ncbi:hypothetical protein BV20DRAFT_854202 [Pilatotrama ljubarskyi]|nr:hypothetical protein BV20DRAFT_854202 [Pilatotrama ljubarskyi]